MDIPLFPLFPTFKRTSFRTFPYLNFSCSAALPWAASTSRATRHFTTASIAPGRVARSSWCCWKTALTSMSSIDRVWRHISCWIWHLICSSTRSTTSASSVWLPRPSSNSKFPSEGNCRKCSRRSSRCTTFLGSRGTSRSPGLRRVW